MRFTCPCCGYVTFTNPPGSYDLCPICFWEDDPVQLLDPGYAGGANALSLIDSQRSYAERGACLPASGGSVRPPRPDETRDPEWRPAVPDDLKSSRSPKDLSDEEYRRLDAWYYWKRLPR